MVDVIAGKVQKHYDKCEAFVCDCSDASHNIIWQIWEWGDTAPELSIHVNLGEYPGFWRRFWLGVKYIFGYKSKYGQYDVMTVRPEDVARMKAILDQYEADIAKFEKGSE